MFFLPYFSLPIVGFMKHACNIYRPLIHTRRAHRISLGDASTGLHRIAAIIMGLQMLDACALAAQDHLHAICASIFKI